LALLMWLGWIPVVAVYILLIQTFGHFTPAFLGIYLLLHYAAGIGQAFWHCPQCGKYFSNPWRFFLRGSGCDQGIARACVHCGLPRFAVDDSGLTRLCPKWGYAMSGRYCSQCGIALNIDSDPTPGVSTLPPKFSVQCSTLFMLRYLRDLSIRQRISAGLAKGESRNSLARDAWR
jgi:hypothetical protein